MEQYRAETHNGHVRGIDSCCKVSISTRLASVGTGITGVAAVCADMSPPVLLVQFDAC